MSVSTQPDRQNLTLGVLVITATVLLVGLLISGPAGTQPAYAIGQLDRGGDYIMVTGQFTDSTEMVYIVDAAAQRMHVYSFDSTTRNFVLWDALDLRSLFGQSRK